MKDLCIDARLSFHSGIGTYIRNLIPLLQKSSLKLRLIVQKELLDKWPKLQTFDLIVTSAPVFSIEEQFKLPLLIPACDYFWSPHYNIPLGAIRAKRRLVTIHDVYHLAHAKECCLAKRLYANLFIRAAVRHSNCIFTISDFSRSEIIKYTRAPRAPIHVIHLGVDRDRFSGLASPDRLEEIRVKYGLREPFFLFVGSIAKHKNIERLLLAWERLSDSLAGWKLVLAGNARKGQAYHLDFKKKSRLVSRTLFLGFVNEDDLPVLYQLAYAIVHPSLYEGFGLTPLEAMSSNRPVIVSKTASLPEICKDSVIYVNPHDPEEIAVKMNELAKNKQIYQDFATRGRIQSCEFSWEKTAAQYLRQITALG